MSIFRRFLRLGAIVGPFPNVIIDGQVVDAGPVMTDFYWLQSQINANVPPLISAGTSPIVFVAAGSVGGTANAITLSPTPAIASYQAGQSYRFVAAATNTGNVTVNVSGLGARNLTLANGNTFAGGEIQTGGAYDIFDNGTQYMMTNFPIGTGLLTAPAPALYFGGASTGITYGTQVSQVMTLGNWVLAWINIVLTSKGTSTGSAAIDLPVKVNNLITGAGIVPMGSVQFSNVTFSGVPGINPTPNTSFAAFPLTATGAANSFLADTNFTNTSAIYAFVVYPGIA